MGIQINGNTDTISALDGSWTSDSATHFTGKVSIGGTLTYEDVTNIDSVGIVTARGGIHAQDDSTFYGVTSGRNVFWDKSENSLEFGDYTYAKFGADEDLTVWSNNTASAINNKTGELRILSGTNVRILKRSDAGLGFAGQVANFNIDGACDFYHSGTKRIETTNTGSVVTGILTATGAIKSGGDIDLDNGGSAGINFRRNGTLKSDIEIGSASDQLAIRARGSSGYITFHTNSSNLERLRITSTGVVSINDTTPETWATLQVKNHTGANAAQVLINGADMAQIMLKDDTGGTNTKITTIRNDQGTLLIGTHNDAYGGFAHKYRITTAGTHVFGGNTAAPIVDNGELLYRGNSTSTFESLPQSFYLYGDSLGSGSANAGTGMVFGGNYKTDGSQTTFAGIHGIKENTTNNEYGGALVFGVRTDGGGAWERLRIDSSGRMGLGTNAPEGYDNEAENFVIASSDHTGITIASTGSNKRTNLYFADGTSGNEAYRGAITYDHNGDFFQIRTSGAEKLLIDSTGHLHVKGQNHEVRFYRDDGARYGAITYDGSNFNIRNPVNDHTRVCKQDGTEIIKFRNDKKVVIDNTDGTFTIGGDNVYNSSKINLQVGSMSQTSATTEATAIVIHDQNSKRNGTESAGSWVSGIRWMSTQINGGSRYGAFINQDITYNNFSGGATKMRSDLVFGTRGDVQTGSGDPPVERLRIDSLGAVNIGTAGTGYSIWNALAQDVQVKFQVRCTVGEPAGMALLEERGDSNAASFMIGKSRYGSGVGAITSGDSLGWIKFSGADGTRQHNAAGILGWNNGTIATGRVAGNLSFYTSPDAVGSLTEHLRISSNGNITIGAHPAMSATSHARLWIEHTGNNLSSEWDPGDNQGTRPHMTLAGINNHVRLDMGTMDTSPFAGYIQARFDNTPDTGATDNADGLEPLQIQPRGGQTYFNFGHSTAYPANFSPGSAQGGIKIRAGTADSASVSEANTAIKIWPAAERQYSSGRMGDADQGSKYGGISWLVMDGQSPGKSGWAAYDGNQCWMGMSLHSTPGQELGNWQLRMNNSGTQNSVANNIALQASPDGWVTKPRHIVFMAHHNAGTRITATGYQTFGDQIEDNGGDHYSNSNGKFTAPIGGYYYLYLKVNAVNRIDMQIRINGSTDHTHREIGQFNTSNAAGGWWSHNIVRIFRMEKNEYAQVYISSLNQQTDPGEWCTFGGFLIG